ncbi:sensor histidine kinase [Alteromonas sp. BL110]|uniref:HAMP domain-containing sensor histidine kinase n=1 Tax=Alteromonas sp. BL110 TaxID=1714845 RepID=UPI000E524D52|nr:HAMP domain-containing sensor histidine kinase [Alteromonas sp. BL110]AXT39400.1 sensor histidine kinase [Alteromonas sp. BL110]RKM82114.1 HAMP domain-containing protein [Alteromonas sp. BL110]
MIAIRDFTRSSSFRVGVLLTTLACIAIVLIVYFWRLTSSDLFISESNAAVNAKANALITLYENLGIDAVKSAIIIDNNQPPSSAKTSSSSFEHLRSFVVLSKDERVIAGNLASVPLVLERYKGASFDTAEIVITQPNSSSRKTLRQALIREDVLGDYTLYVGRGIDDLYSAQWFGKTFSWIIVVLLCALSILSFAIAVYVVNRINRMSQTADKIIKTGNLEERLEIDSNWDDLSSLSFVFNQMLDTIESSVNNIKSVTDSIAHDLRTPLSRLRNTLERIEDDQLREDTTQEADNLLNMFNSLLRISGLETTNKKEGFCSTDVRAIVEDVVDLYHPLAEERNIQLSSQLESVSMLADPNLLFQAVANVLDNAIKYSNEDSRVTVQLTTTSRLIVIAVNDAGIGVGEHEIVNLERRFYRADGSRTSKGNGLGLSLVSAIVKLHDGHTWFVHDPLMQGNGLGVVFCFPR